MNKAFTKTKELVLDERYKIIPDADNGVILVFSEIRAKKDSKSENLIPFDFKQEYHFPRIAQALRKYADLTLNEIHDFDSLIQRLNDVYLIIDSIDQTFKQF